MGLSLGGILGIAAAPFTGGASLALTGADLMNSANDASVKKQMEFQQYNSDTAYQRAVKDMSAAGINPMLASQLGGASTPSGASNTNHQSGFDSMTSARSANSAIGLQKAQIDNTVSSTQLNSANVAKSKADTLASIANANNANANARNTEVNTRLNLARLPAEQNSAAAANTWYGRNITPYLPSLGGASNIVKNVK